MMAENQAKILIIDDNDMLLMQVEEVLTQNNYTPICVDSGAKGLEKAASEQPDLILLDRRMPEMDGNETLKQLKANDNTKHIPVVMLTGDNKISDVQASFELGAVDYVVKPFEPHNLLNSLKKFLEESGE